MTPSEQSRRHLPNLRNNSDVSLHSFLSVNTNSALNHWRKGETQVFCWNVSSEQAALVCGGKLFHARTAAMTRDRRGLTDRLMAPASPGSRQSVDGNEQQPLTSAAGCQLDTPVLCCAHSDMPEHTTGNGFAPGRVTSAVRLCAISCLCQYKLAVVGDWNWQHTHTHIHTADC